MSKIDRFLEMAKKKGLNETIKRGMKKIIGLKDFEDEVDTLYYFLNKSLDITQFPKATGNLIKLQEADTLLLAILDKLFEKHNIEYWLDAGTLLGAVRHQGFIPWDDDTDICIFRDDYGKALKLINEELNQFGIYAGTDEINPGLKIGVGYRNAETGVWADIFPVDFSNADLYDAKRQEEELKQCKQYLRKWKIGKYKWNYEYADAQREKIIKSICHKDEAKSVIYNLEIEQLYLKFDVSSVLPTRRITFESFKFKVPNNTDNYLKKKYGNSYMEFPRWGVNHHESEQGRIQDWAERNGVNMDEVIEYLDTVLHKI